MKHLLIMLMAMTLTATGAFAAENKKGYKPEKITLSGVLVDNKCAAAHRSNLEQFIKSHTKECALKPDCAASGYSLYHYGALIRFDRESSKKIEQFLKKKNSSLSVIVEAEKSGNEYRLISIRNK